MPALPFTTLPTGEIRLEGLKKPKFRGLFTFNP